MAVKTWESESAIAGTCTGCCAWPGCASPCPWPGIAPGGGLRLRLRLGLRLGRRSGCASTRGVRVASGSVCGRGKRVGVGSDSSRTEAVTSPQP